MERKEFIKKFAYGGSILLTAPAILSACSSSDDDYVPDDPNEPNTDLTIDLTSSTYSDLRTIGGFVYAGNIMIFRTGENTLSGTFKNMYTPRLYCGLCSC